MKLSITNLIKGYSNKYCGVTGLLLLLTIVNANSLFGAAANADFSIDKASPVVGEEVRFTNASTNATNYRWSFGDGASLTGTVTSVGPHNVSYSTAGSKTVRLIVDSSAGGAGDTEEKSVTVYGTYYYNGTGSPSDASSWNSRRDGTGSYSPANFSSGYQTFVIQSGQTCITTNTWPLSGPQTNIVIENGAILIAEHAIGIASSSLTVQIGEGARYEHNNSSGHIWNGVVNATPSSTIIYGFAGDQNIAGINYGNLIVSNGGDKILLGNVSISGSLNLSGAKIVLGQRNLTMNYGAAIIEGESFSPSNMIVTEGSGMFIKEGVGSIDFLGVYPVGSGGRFSPFQVAELQSVGAGSIAVRANAGNAPGGNSTDLQRYWTTTVTGIMLQSASIRFTYSEGERPNPISYEPKVFQNGSWADIPGGQNISTNIFGGVGISDLTGIWTLREPLITYYSYQSGSWDNANTWTTDPSGTLSVNPGVPSPTQRVVILNGRDVFIPNNDKSVFSLEIQNGGTLDLRSTSGHNFGIVGGEGTLRLQTNNFPGGNFDVFTTAGGGL